MSFLRSRRGAVAVVAAVVLALFLIRPGADQLRSRIVQAISLGIGRPVEVSSVSIRLLPRPGFDLQNFVVHEDPAFGAEPTLRASEVTASLRVISLLRGRLEIARLNLTEPSVNLVRNAAGRWNLENLLERADQAHVAPTSKATTEARLGFPYIEANAARINFKFGQEKTPYTLTDAVFSVWQDSENAWGMRLKAQPVRTDSNLSDTGIIRIEGAWQRAASLRDTPLRFFMQWERGQLGQATALFYGSDQGWRGTVAISAVITGTPGDLMIRSNAAVDDFRRYDLDGNSVLRLSAQCEAHYAPLENRFSALLCTTPVGRGFVALKGNLGGYDSSRTYDLSLSAKDIPMQALVALARHAKKNIPSDLTATGTLEAAFELQRTPGAHGPVMVWTGSGETRSFAISSVLTGTSLSFDKIPFSIASGTPARLRGGLHTTMPAWTHISAVPHLEIGPVKLALGKPAPVFVNIRSSRSEYELTVQGDAGIQRFLQLARSIGLPAAQPTADGTAKVDLQIAGLWSAFSPATILGQAQLRSVRAVIRGMNQPLEIASANVTLLPSGVEVKDVTASLAGSTWHGSLAMPRQCIPGAQCLVRFNLHAETIATDAWNDLLKPSPDEESWYSMFARNAQPKNTLLFNLHASGQISATQMMIHKLPAANVSARVDLDGGILRLTDLDGEVLGGKHTGEWKADFTVKPPQYSGSGTLKDIDLSQLSQTMHDGWVTGSGSANYTANASGLTTPELMSSADASLDVLNLEGTFPHIVLESDAGPWQVNEFSGRVLLHQGSFEVADCKVASNAGSYKVNGTASLSGVLNLKLERANAGGFTIVGPLTAPNVSQTSAAETTAALKP